MPMPPMYSNESKFAKLSNKNPLDLFFDNSPVRIVPANPDIQKTATDMIQEYSLEEAFYICDLGKIVEKHVEWITHLSRVRPFYAVKCNDSPLVLATLAGLGTGFDCASKVEMQKVMNLGVSPRDIIFANPAKHRSHIVAASQFGIKMTTFDSETELYKLKKHFPGAKLIVRIRCDDETAQGPLGMKFGVSVREATRLLNVAKGLNLDVVGVSFHVGSGCRDAPVFLRAITFGRLMFDVAEEIGYDFKILDIGGGFPGNTGTSITEIAGVVNSAIDQFFPVGCGVGIIAEPGRYHVASAFTLFTQIHFIREVEGDEEGDHPRYMYYINDGIYGSLCCVMFDNRVVHPEILDKRKADCSKLECSIWGPTLDGLDQVCSREFLPKMNVGEWIAFKDMGAYTLVARGTFNGFPLPKLTHICTQETWNILKNFV